MVITKQKDIIETQKINREGTQTKHITTENHQFTKKTAKEEKAKKDL